LLITLITLMHFIVSFEILKLVTLDWIFYLIMGLIWIMLIIEIIVSLQILSWKFMKPNLISLARILSIPTSGDILMIAHLKGVKMWESDYTNKQYIESIEKRRSDNELTIIFENKYIFYFKP
ncbi:MAG: hypothetical protein OEY49_19565, partial [Candidatus Heimdallarchaeota archaeon]|nr:hypothetical protein [Candidatus Heimdallarchaeota archaeon]